MAPKDSISNEVLDERILGMEKLMSFQFKELHGKVDNIGEHIKSLDKIYATKEEVKPMITAYWWGIRTLVAAFVGAILVSIGWTSNGN